MPVVAIVGRTNVGKSSLFNALLGERQAIVADEPGTTRDTIYAAIEHSGRHFILADTAGLLTSPQDEFESRVQEQISEAAATADLIVVVVEAETIPTDEDRRVSKLALKSGKPVILVTNKIDQSREDRTDQWRRTGISTILATSTTQRRGLGEVLDMIISQLPSTGSAPSPADLTIALIGRPNVGKSSLFNALADKQQALVAAQAGTTRDVNHIDLRYHSKTLRLLDTAGIRRPGKVGRGVEHFSVLRAIAAIEQSDICVLLIDANEPGVALEQKLAGLIKDAGKGLILGMSKWDSVEKDPHTADAIAHRITADFQHVWWAPLIFTSALSGQNITKLFELITQIAERRRQKFPTPELNRLLEDAVAAHPPSGLKNRHPRLRYATQTDINPPTLRIFGRHVSYLHWSYKRRLEKLLRDKYDLVGTPVKLYFSDNE